MTYATDFSHASADVVHSPPYRGRVRLRARTIAGTEALESLLDREGAGHRDAAHIGEAGGNALPLLCHVVLLAGR